MNSTANQDYFQLPMSRSYHDVPRPTRLMSGISIISVTLIPCYARTVVFNTVEITLADWNLDRQSSPSDMAL